MSVSFNEIGSVVMAVMITTFEALLVFILFLPGFISQRIIELLTPRRKRSNLIRVIDGAALSVVIYLLYLALASVANLPPLPISFDATQKTIANINGWAALAILGIGVMLGMIIAKGLEFGCIFKVLRAEYIKSPKPDDTGWCARFVRKLKSALQFTRSTGRATVWEDVLSEVDAPLLAISLADGRKIIGRCSFFSDDPEHPEIVITAPDPRCVQQPELQGITVIADGVRQKLPGTGIFITSAAEIETIELLGGVDVK